MKKLRRFLARVWQPVLLYGLGAAIVCVPLFFRLGTLTPGFAIQEITSRHSSLNSQSILDNPVNAPHKLGQYVLQKIERRGPQAMRLVSALFGLLAVILFFIMLASWFTTRIAALGSLLLASSSWFLHSVRLATPDVMLLAPLTLIACGLWLRHGHKRYAALLTSALVAAVVLYIPGMVWFVGIFATMQLPLIISELRRVRPLLLMPLVLLVVVALLPLILASIRQPLLLKDLAGLPQHFDGFAAVGKRMARLPLYLLIRGPQDPVRGLGRLPLLDVFSATMFVLGIYKLYFQRRLARTKLFIMCLALGSLLAVLGGQVNMVVLLPFIYVVVAAGFTLLLQQWFTVFPHNPVARGVAVFLLSVVIGSSMLYHSRQYFVAWPQAPETKQAFNQAP